MTINPKNFSATVSPIGFSSLMLTPSKAYFTFLRFILSYSLSQCLATGRRNATIVKVRVKDRSELDKFFTAKLRALPDIFLTTTMIITREFK